jgi:hypothetical protein
LNNREFSTERSKELQHDLIDVICHELGSISNYTFNNLMRELNPESHAPPLTVITEENQEKEFERREKFVYFLHDVCVSASSTTCSYAYSFTVDSV